MKLSELKVGDVIVMHGHDIMIVTDINSNRPKNPIVVQKKLGKDYVCSPSNILQVIGTVDLSKLEDSKNAKQEEDQSFNQFLIPTRLKDMGLEAGVSQIRVRHGGKILVATYGGYIPSRYKYPINYTTSRGGRYKGKEDSVIEKVS